MVWDIVYLGDVLIFYVKVGEDDYDILRVIKVNMLCFVENLIMWDDFVVLLFDCDVGVILIG